jgi:hypothetical protein
MSGITPGQDRDATPTPKPGENRAPTPADLDDAHHVGAAAAIMMAVAHSPHSSPRVEQRDAKLAAVAALPAGWTEETRTAQSRSYTVYLHEESGRLAWTPQQAWKLAAAAKTSAKKVSCADDEAVDADDEAIANDPKPAEIADCLISLEECLPWTAVRVAWGHKQGPWRRILHQISAGGMAPAAAAADLLAAVSKLEAHIKQARREIEMAAGARGLFPSPIPLPLASSPGPADLP